MTVLDLGELLVNVEWCRDSCLFFTGFQGDLVVDKTCAVEKSLVHVRIHCQSTDVVRCSSVCCVETVSQCCCVRAGVF